MWFNSVYKNDILKFLQKYLEICVLLLIKISFLDPYITVRPITRQVNNLNSNLPILNVLFLPPQYKTSGLWFSDPSDSFFWACDKLCLPLQFLVSCSFLQMVHVCLRKCVCLSNSTRCVHISCSFILWAPCPVHDRVLTMTVELRFCPILLSAFTLYILKLLHEIHPRLESSVFQ